MNRKIKILHLSNNPEASLAGGTERFFDQFVNHMPEYEHVVIGSNLVYQSGIKNGLESYDYSFERGHGGRWFRVKEILLFPWTMIQSLFFVIKFYPTIQSADIVIYSNGSLNSMVTYTPILKLLGKKMLYIFHGEFPQNKFYNWGILGYYWRQCFRHVDVVSISRTVQNSVKSLNLNESKNHLIYNGTNVPKNLIYNEQKTQTLGYIGSLKKIKGVRTLIEFIQSYNHTYNHTNNPSFNPSYNHTFKGPKLEIIIQGEGELYGEILELSKSNTKDSNTQITLKPYGTDIDQFYGDIGALIVPSLSEGFGLVVIEAMARGVVVICSDIEVFKELNSITGNNNLLFHSGDPKDLADKISFYIDNIDQYDENLRNSLQHSIAQNFDISTQMSKYKELINLIVEEHQT